MQAYCTLTRRELAAFFCSITGYVIIAGLAFSVGFLFVWLISNIGNQPFDMPITQLFFNNFMLWIIIIFTVPMITMRLFALEKASGTFENLVTTPVSDLALVASKFTAAAVFFIVMMLPTVAALFVVQHFADQASALETGTVLAMYLGVFCAGCLLLSIGCLASALTKSQVVAAMVSLVAGLTMLVLNGLAQNLNAADHWQARVLSLFNLTQQMIDFTRGVLDTRVLVFYLSGTFLFLFLTLRVIESRRWK